MDMSVPIASLGPERFRSVLTPDQAVQFDRMIAAARDEFAGRVIWNVNSTAAGGGVAEMLQSLIGYGRGAGVDARWLVIRGDPDFFRVTKRLHNRLHGTTGDGGPLGQGEREIYESVTQRNALELSKLLAPGDIVLLHDPQTAGLVVPLQLVGARVIWRCHIGLDKPNRLARSAWRFLLRYVVPADAYVFSREAFAWDDLDRSKLAIVAPSIDAFAPKNQAMERRTSASILYTARIYAHNGSGRPVFTRADGSPGRVDRRAKKWEASGLTARTPIVTQVSRWDALKDPLGVIDAFAAHVAPRSPAHLVLAGPDVAAVADDPEGVEVLEACGARWASLAPKVRERVHLLALPMLDLEENAAIVNALQRRSAVVVQKSLAEGFGLTVAEAMWKGRPVVASRIGGIQDQIVDGESGMLVDPADLEQFGAAVAGLLADPARADRMGAAAQTRVRESFLGPRHLTQYFELFKRVIDAAEAHERALA
jgi:trehalose synthase